MASEVEICNLALAHLGDAATVASINPPEGSAQAEHCARFYPVARDALLEMHDWSFATKRVTLPMLATNPTIQWGYAYAAPNDMVNVISVLDSQAPDDSSAPLFANAIYAGYPTTLGIGDMSNYQVIPQMGLYMPQPFSLEVGVDGSDVIYTNQENAALRYVAKVTDTTKFSPLFVRVLAASLASMLAGPVLKGEAGATMSMRWQIVAFGQDGKSGLFAAATASDSGNKRTGVRDRQQVSWVVGR